MLPLQCVINIRVTNEIVHKTICLKAGAYFSLIYSTPAFKGATVQVLLYQAAEL